MQYTKIMKRRNFVKQSIAGAIIAATPLALTGLVRAEGGGGTGSTSTDWWDSTGTNDWWDSTGDTTPNEDYTTSDDTDTTGEDMSDPLSCVYLPDDIRSIYIGGKCYVLAKVDVANDPDIQQMPPQDRPDNPECVIAVLDCAKDVGIGTSSAANCDALKNDFQDENGNDTLGPNFLKAMYCGYESV